MQGQASVEYAGLLAIAAVLGASLALAGGPPLASAVRDALTAVLARGAVRAAPVVPTAADIADVQSALLARDDAITPDAALLALRRRHPAGQASGIAAAVLLAAARRSAPWLATPRTYRAWHNAADGPYETPATVTGDRDVEEPTGPAQVTWVTVGAQRGALTSALAHHTSLTALALDVAGVIPGARLVRAGSRAERTLQRIPRTIDRGIGGEAIVALLNVDDGDIPAGVRAGDVVVSWPVHRTYWRDGRIDPSPRIELGATSSALPVRAYRHRVFLRPGAHGLAVVAEGFGT